MAGHFRRRRSTAPSALDADFMEALGGGSRSRRRRGPGHKDYAVCRQAFEALSLALAGECNDDVLRELHVEAVEPAPDASRLLVRIAIPSRCGAGAVEVLARLERAKGLLRTAVAQAITRKRAPELMFMPVADRLGGGGA